MVSKNKVITGAAAVVTAGSLAFAGASLASADTTPSGSATSGTTTTTQQGDRDNDRGFGRGGHDHTAVTGAEATKVTAAVTAKDSTVKVERVMKDPDGSYDVIGTKDGARVMVEVSVDLKTVEVRTGMGPGGRGGKDSQAPTQGTSPSAPGASASGAAAVVPSTGTSPTDIPAVAA